MGFFTKLDQQIVDLMESGCKDADVVEAIRIEYNGLVNEQQVLEVIDTVRMGDYDDPYYPYP